MFFKAITLNSIEADLVLVPVIPSAMFFFSFFFLQFNLAALIRRTFSVK